MAGSLILSGNQFHIAGPDTEKAGGKTPRVPPSAQGPLVTYGKNFLGASRCIDGCCIIQRIRNVFT